MGTGYWGHLKVSPDRIVSSAVCCFVWLLAICTAFHMLVGFCFQLVAQLFCESCDQETSAYQVFDMAKHIINHHSRQDNRTSGDIKLVWKL